MANTKYIRSSNGRYIGAYRLDTQIIVGLLIIFFAIISIAWIFKGEGATEPAQAATVGTTSTELMFVHANAIPITDLDLTDTSTRLEIYGEAKNGALHWVTDDVTDVSKYQAKYSYAPATVLKTIVSIAKKKGYTDIDHLLALINCESHFQVYATNARGNLPNGSVDRGIAMWSNYWQRNISDSCAFDASCAVGAMVDALKAGHENLWVCNKLVK